MEYQWDQAQMAIEGELIGLKFHNFKNRFVVYVTQPSNDSLLDVREYKILPYDAVLKIFYLLRLSPKQNLGLYQILVHRINQWSKCIY